MDPASLSWRPFRWEGIGAESCPSALSRCVMARTKANGSILQGRCHRYFRKRMPVERAASSRRPHSDIKLRGLDSV